MRLQYYNNYYGKKIIVDITIQLKIWYAMNVTLWFIDYDLVELWYNCEWPSNFYSNNVTTFSFVKRPVIHVIEVYLWIAMAIPRNTRTNPGVNGDPNEELVEKQVEQVHDDKGRLVRVHFIYRRVSIFDAGYYCFSWNALPFSRGIYNRDTYTRALAIEFEKTPAV